ncbi:putative F420-dependent oxidoreductase/probable F420-dependent oxidoreductase [Kribbella amoyensis]|uniref:Putative F420-dependent oxidoreductase/probable F420-dependent oxidoreductase n=1 Tax=Kribbella amoyensis TaxID=996641 RepID=A0A561BNV8_9ACTN|nr:LLM class F420-dependent oxidoreductase [Kribbella amoyensis]TWD80554.1 putative F420-dependent oxidoreductase/probable F420-dependent oxidoreductase [Kribbella amoyensis]
MRWGLTVPLTGVPLREHRALIAELAELGYTDLWSAEVAGADAFTPLVLASEWDERLRLGTAVVPVHTRGPAALAMSAATLADLASGRFVLGIGASSETIVTGWNGIAYDPPLARTRDVLRFLRQAFAGEKVDGEFDSFTIRRFRLEKAPDVAPAIMLAALRPQMLRLAAREADGAITNWLSPGDVRQVRAELGDDKELAARIFVCATEDTEMARNLGRYLIATYLTVPGYAAFHDWLGRAEALAPMHAAWKAGDRNAAMAAVPESVIDDLVVHGSPEDCRARIREYLDHGLDTPIIATLPTGGSLVEVARSLAP